MILNGIFASFARANPDHFIDRSHKYFAVADLTGASALGNQLDYLCRAVGRN
jgi:hypothetical protein